MNQMDNLVRFKIGIVGHRDIAEENIAHTKRRIELILNELMSAHTIKGSHESYCPLEIVTGLAPGADSIVANVALSMNIPVVAALPMEVADYQSDFSGEADDPDSELHEFNHLLSQCYSVHSLTPENADNKKSDNIDRKAHYQNQANWMALHANLIICLWDGLDTNLEGGTSALIKSALLLDEQVTNHTNQRLQGKLRSQIRNVHMPFVYWLPVKRTHPKTDNQNTTLKQVTVENGFLRRGETTTKDGLLINHSIDHTADTPLMNFIPFKVVVEGMKRFNRDVIKLADSDPNLVSQSAQECEQQLSTLPVDKSDRDGLLSLLKTSKLADMLALKYQVKSDFAFSLLAWITSLLGVVFLVHAKLIAHSYLALGYLIIIFSGILVYRNSRKRKLLEKHLFYRSLTELLRVKMWWTATDITRPSAGENIEDQTLSSIREEDAWVLHLARGATLHTTTLSATEQQQHAAIDTICELELSGQLQYFKKKARKPLLNSGVHFLVHHHVPVILAILAMLGSFWFMWQYEGLAGQDASQKSFYLSNKIAVFIAALVPFLFAVLEKYIMNKGLDEIAFLNDMQFQRFERAYSLIKHANTLAFKKAVLTSIGEEALIENYSWLMIRYHRTHTPAQAG